MGILDFLFGKTKPQEPAQIPTSHKSTSSESLDLYFLKKFLSIRSINFYGGYSKSPNGRYILGYQDFDYRGRERGGFRESGHGRCVLIEEARLVYQVDLERPEEGVVSDTGFAAVYDIGFGEKPKGTFCLFDPSGNKIIDYLISARIPVCGVSDSGLAWLHTGFQTLLIFRAFPPQFLCQVACDDPPDLISQCEEEIQVSERGIKMRFNLAGDLLNPEETEQANIQWLFLNGDQWSLARKADQLFEGQKASSLSPETADLVRKLCETAIKRGDESWHRAKLHRKLGELAEGQGDKVEALKQFTLAIEFDPKVGCKRALSKLEKEVRNKVR